MFSRCLEAVLIPCSRCHHRRKTRIMRMSSIWTSEHTMPTLRTIAIRIRVTYSPNNKIVRWWTHDSSRRGLQRAFGALAAARADGPRHTPPPLERQLRKSGAVLRSLIVHITTYLECIRARSRSLLPTALKSERSAHHSCQKTVPTLHANVTFDFSHENRYASA